MYIVLKKRDGKIINAELVGVEKSDLKAGDRLDIPEGITEIGKDALKCFRGVDDIKLQIKMPSSVTTIKAHSLSNLHIQNIELSENLKKIGNNAFSNTKFVSKVKIPDSVLHIPNECFSSASFSDGIELPQRLESIGYRAFEETDIKELKIPDNVRELKFGIFMRSSVEKVILPKNLIRIPENAFCYTRNLSEIEIPHSVKEIESQAFFSSSLEKVLLHDGLQRVEVEAFSYTNVEKISLPSTIYYIGSRCFYGCHNLRSVDFPQSLKYINNSAFEDCMLTTVSLPENVKIGSSAFQYNQLSMIRLSKEEYNQINSRTNQAFKNNPSLRDICVRDSMYNSSQFLSKRKVKKIGKRTK